MVQGKSKGLQKKVESSRHAAKSAAKPKKGRRAIAPRKAPAVKTAALHKKLSSKISHSIEQQLVSTASPDTLTILRNENPAESSKSGSSKKAKK